MAKTPVVAEVYTFALPPVKAEVESSNTVGYTKLNLVKGLNLVAAPFVAPGGTAADINETMSSDDLSVGTVAKFWDPSTKTYSTAYYYDDDVYTDDSYEDTLGPGWGNIDAIVIDQTMNRGEGFWVQAANVSTQVFAGEVSTNAVALTLVKGLNLVGNPFPADISIQNITSEGFGAGTVAKFWNPSSKTYGTAYYYDDDVYTDDSYEDALGPGWGDIDAIVLNVNIGAMEGFWIQAGAATTATLAY